jgi:hypothetical protein
MFVVIRLAAALKSRYIMYPVTQADKISQQNTPFTNTVSREGTRKLNPQKRYGNLKEIIVKVETTK